MTARISDDVLMFELAPVSLWLEDYSALKSLFETWRQQGVLDLRTYLGADPQRVVECSQCIRIIKVNRKTLNLYEAIDVQQLMSALDRVFRDDMLPTHIEELAQLWDGKTNFSSNTVNYTLSGRRLDIQLNASILPGHEQTWTRVLVAIEDVTDREVARRQLAREEDYARALFDDSPVSLWVEDFSAVKNMLDDIRSRGISDFRTFISVHPEFVERAMREIRVIDINRQTLTLLGGTSKSAILNRLNDVFRGEMLDHFGEQLIDLWHGRLFQQREVINYSLAGDPINVYLQLSVVPGYEHTWSLVLVALTDITARKKAEAYLEYLGKHDVLTKLNNRSYYVDELNRLERNGPYPITIIMADLNELKATNDRLGHAAGDDLLRRAGEVLAEATGKICSASRIGGDEFAILMAATDEAGGTLMIEHIKKLVDLNNQFYGNAHLSLAMGAATTQAGERLEQVLLRADALMYRDKATYYSESPGTNRRHDDRQD